MQNKYFKLLAILISLTMVFASCQMEMEMLENEVQQPSSTSPSQEGKESTTSDVINIPSTSPSQEGKESTTSDLTSFPSSPTAPEIILGVTCVQVQFHPNTGSLYYQDGSISPLPKTVLLTTGYTISLPQEIPYKAGYKFRGWSQQQPEDGLTFEETRPWDFETALLTKPMTLYAYFEDVSDEEADSEPKIVGQQQNPSYTDNSIVYSLDVSGVPEVTSLGKSPDSNGLYTFFATDVTKDEGWYNTPQYMNHCWATSSSQMIFWYQGQLNKLGKTPATSQPSTIQELRDWFANEHSDFSGWHIQWALAKYFQAFYPDNLSDITTYRRDGYYFSLQTLSDLLLKHLSRGDMCGLTAVNFDGGLHAMNIYGAQFNADGIVETLYVTSSPTLDEEGLKNHKPRLYEFKQDGLSSKGAPQWKATYDISKDGYISTSEAAIQNIYGLDFLSVTQ